MCVLLHNLLIEWDDATPVEPLMRRLVQGEKPVEALIGRPFARLLRLVVTIVMLKHRCFNR